jgi:hypothetical protein
MRAAVGRATAWGLWRRHRIGLVAIGVYTALLVLVVAATRPGAYSEEFLAFLSVALSIPFGMACAYLLPVFSYGFECDVASAESCFPARLFTLPVSVADLVLWPALFGALTLSLLWLALAGVLALGYLEVSLGWPVLLAVALLVWLQAVVWTPYGLPWLRLVVAVPVLATPITVAYLGVNELLPWAWTHALLALLVVLGVAVSLAGVRLARRGAGPGWRRAAATTAGPAPVVRRRPFRSAFGAQLWCEWRRHGLSLPLGVSLILPFVFVPLFFGTGEAVPLSQTLLIALALPVFISPSATATAGKHNPWVREYYGIPPFNATRPMSTAGLVAAKLGMAVLSTAATWALTVSVTLLAVVVSGNGPALVELARKLFAGWPAYQVAGTVFAVVFFVMLLTFKRLVENLAVGLSGRVWFIRGNVLLGALIWCNLGVLVTWVYFHPESQESVRAAMPWIVGTLVAVKLGLGVWVVRRLLARELIPARTLTWLTVAWLAVAGVLAGLLVWLVPEGWISPWVLAASVVLVLPLVRFAAMPLALAWDRHR